MERVVRVQLGSAHWGREGTRFPRASLLGHRERLENDELDGRSGAVVAVSNVGGLAGGLLPLAVAFVAEAAGLGAAMWGLLFGPLALLLLLPRR